MIRPDARETVTCSCLHGRSRLQTGKRSLYALLSGWLLLTVCMSACSSVQVYADTGRVRIGTDDTVVGLEVHNHRLFLTSLLCPQTGWDWVAGADAEGTLLPFIDTALVGGRPIQLNWRFVGDSYYGGPPHRYVFTFVATNAPLELRSSWAASPGPGPVEHTLTITNRGASDVVLPLQTSLTLATYAPLHHTLENWWVEKGGARPTDAGTHSATVTPAFAASLLSLPYAADGAFARDAIPWTAVQDIEGRQGWYAGVEFSGRIRIGLQGVTSHDGSGGVRANLGLDPVVESPFPYSTRITAGETFQAPPAFVGCYVGDVDAGANRLHRWVESSLRPSMHDRNYPLLTNAVRGEGKKIDEVDTHEMIDASVALGMELFQLDNDWYRAVGDWRPDPAKFPHGIVSLADYAHTKGLKFGLSVNWTQGGNVRSISKNSVAKANSSKDNSLKDNIGREPLSVKNLSMAKWFTRDYPSDWKPTEDAGADICLSDPQAVDWSLGELRQLVDQNRLDVLAHAQRIIVDSCDRADHPHSASPADIAYQSTLGYYRVYDQLRAQHPNLLLTDSENGGRLIDYGVARRVHEIRLTEAVDPLSSRRAFYDASFALPPSLCACYVACQPSLSLNAFRAILRSGMLGACTVTSDIAHWSKEQQEAARQQFQIYKTWLRPLIVSGDLYHIAQRPDGVRWDGMQYVDPHSGRGALYAFRGTGPENRHTFQCKGLEPSARYRVWHEDDKSQSSIVTGTALMQTGIILQLDEPGTSEIIYLQKLP